MEHLFTTRKGVARYEADHALRREREGVNERLRTDEAGGGETVCISFLDLAELTGRNGGRVSRGSASSGEYLALEDAQGGVIGDGIRIDAAKLSTPV